MPDPKRRFMLFFDITRWSGEFVINTDLPVRPIPRGTVTIPRKTAGPEPEARICPKLTEDMQRLLGAMIERELEEGGQAAPLGLVADMEAIVLTVYTSSDRQSIGVPTGDLMNKVVLPIMRIGQRAQAAACDIGQPGSDETLVPDGAQFVSMLIEAARGVPSGEAQSKT